MKAKYFCAIVFLCLLTACGSTSAPSQSWVTDIEIAYDPAVFKRASMGYVVFSAWNNMPSRLDVLNYITFENDKGDKYVNAYASGQKEALMLPIGNYKITSYYLNGADSYQSITSDRLDKIKDFTFSVSDNSCVYIGQLTIRYGDTVDTDRNFFSGSTTTTSKISIYVDDQSSKFSENEKQLYLSQSGGECTVRLMEVVDK